MDKVQTVCLGFEPMSAGWQAQKNPQGSPNLFVCLRLIHTRRSGLHFLQWAVSTQRQENFYLPAEIQPSAADARRKCSNVNEPLFGILSLSFCLHSLLLGSPICCLCVLHSVIERQVAVVVLDKWAYLPTYLPLLIDSLHGGPTYLSLLIDCYISHLLKQLIFMTSTQSSNMYNIGKPKLIVPIQFTVNKFST